MLDGVENPGASKCPIAFCGGKRYTQSLRCFLIRHISEVTQLDYFGFNRMIFGEIVQHLMDGKQLLVSAGRGQIQPLQVNPFETGPVTYGEFAARPVNKDAAHGLSSGRKK
jgi:hypothetical protein